MVSRAMPTIRTDSYNALGQYVLRERGDMSLRQVARRGNIDNVKLSRWLRKDLSERMPPPDVVQAIADGLGRPLSAVQQVALRAAGQSSPTLLNDEQQTVVGAMSQLDERWQRAISDVVLRLTEEFHRNTERLEP